MKGSPELMESGNNIAARSKYSYGATICAIPTFPPFYSVEYL